VGAKCQTTVTCNSGTRESFTFECSSTGTSWVIATTELSCDQPPHDECYGPQSPGYFMCIESTWTYSGYGGDAGTPQCPRSPEEGSECVTQGFGGFPSACGYPCENGAWTVMGCEPEADQWTWKSDGACSAGGAGGAGGAP
jgi:hypothetical protein